ncbi:hypothetical protein FQA39_LY11919 [Lamprigera yunnana]|nr:hypothetical protein FQA39_LY11919 [Lamprigera yunnana]
MSSITDRLDFEKYIMFTKVFRSALRRLTSYNLQLILCSNEVRDHALLLGKIKIKIQTSPSHQYVNKINIESIDNDSTKHLYAIRLTKYITQPEIEENTIDAAWYTTKTAILKAAKETLGEKKVNINSNKTTKKILWFSSEIQELSAQKIQAYLNYHTLKPPNYYEEYKQIRNRVNTRIRKIKEEYLEAFKKQMESDYYCTKNKSGGKESKGRYEGIN